MQSGYDKLRHSRGRDETAGADLWLAAWDVVKELIDAAEAEIRTPEQFDTIFVDALTQSVDTWSVDVEMELGNARYHEQRIVYVHEFLNLFPDVSDETVVSLKRAEADSHWDLGRQDEAETVFRAIVEQYPNDGWGYIGWSDRYYTFNDSPKDYARGEEILLRGLENSYLEDRHYLLERLVDLYGAWDLPEEDKKERLIDVAMLLQEEIENLERQNAEMERSLEESSQERTALTAKRSEQSRKLGRNEPCWCGSGKKYKHCHLKSDQAG